MHEADRQIFLMFLNSQLPGAGPRELDSQESRLLEGRTMWLRRNTPRLSNT
jgi:hypothetical protein